MLLSIFINCDSSSSLKKHEFNKHLPRSISPKVKDFPRSSFVETNRCHNDIQDEGILGKITSINHFSKNDIIFYTTVITAVLSGSHLILTHYFISNACLFVPV